MRKNAFKKIMVSLAALGIAGGCLSGCGPEQAANKIQDNVDVTFPLKEPVKLTYWCKLPDSVLSAGYSNLGDTPLYQELQKRTNVEIEFIHPPKGSEKEKLSLMFASLELPDIIEGDIRGAYAGGIDKALSDGVVYDLNPMLEKYAPNFKSILEQYPQINMDLVNGSGQIGCLPYLRGDSSLLTYQGLMLRKDWLDELGLPVPETIDEWHTTLKAFQEKKGAQAPLAIYNSEAASVQFMSAFGVKDDYFVEDGTVKYGPGDPRCKDYMKTMAQWYREGLIDPEFITNDGKTMDAKIMNDKAGAFIGYLGAGMKKYLDYMKRSNPKFDLVGAPYPTLTKDEPVKFLQKSGPVVKTTTAMITAQNKHPEISLALLDYGYSQEGHMLYNFGIEGESYNMENGYPKFTEIITDNPKGLSMYDSLGLYTRSGGESIFVQDPRYMEQYSNYPQQKQAMATWEKDNQEATKVNRDWRGNLTKEEQDAITQKQLEIDTLKSETFSKWILGAEDVETGFDEFLSKMKAMGLDEILKIKQDAYERLIKQFPEAKDGVVYNVNDYYTK